MPPNLCRKERTSSPVQTGRHMRVLYAPLQRVVVFSKAPPPVLPRSPGVKRKLRAYRRGAARFFLVPWLKKKHLLSPLFREWADSPGLRTLQASGTGRQQRSVPHMHPQSTAVSLQPGGFGALLAALPPPRGLALPASLAPVLEAEGC